MSIFKLPSNLMIMTKNKSTLCDTTTTFRNVVNIIESARRACLMCVCLPHRQNVPDDLKRQQQGDVTPIKKSKTEAHGETWY